jgi:phosphatidate cytidylyltransferase
MAKKGKSDLMPRLITAIVAIPILLYLIFVAPSWAFALLIAWAAATSTWEYVSITTQHEAPFARWMMAAVAAGLFAVLYWAPTHFIGAMAAGVVFPFLVFLFRHDDQSRVTHLMGSAVTGLIYGTVLLGSVALLHRETGTAGPLWIFLTLSIVWLSDTGAYFAGRAFGKHKLYPSVSPNKTIEGALGGFLSSLGFGALCNLGFTSLVGLDGFSTELFGQSWLAVELTWSELTVTQLLLLVLPANLLGQTGDLAESLVKRAHGVKDSGTIIYGHGGMLDRIDALIFAGPWVYYCAVILF